MELPMTAIKYGLFAIIMVVFVVKVWQQTQKIVKNFKKKDELDLDFEEII